LELVADMGSNDSYGPGPLSLDEAAGRPLLGPFLHAHHAAHTPPYLGSTPPPPAHAAAAAAAHHFGYDSVPAFTALGQCGELTISGSAYFG